MTKQEAIEKVKKLLRLSESPNENEAALASAKVKEILAAYNLSGFEFDPESGSVNFITEFSVPLEETGEWVQRLTAAVGIVYNCETYLKTNRDRSFVVLFIGEEAGAKIAAYVFDYLYHTICRESRAKWEEEATKKTIEGFIFLSRGPEDDEWFARLKEKNRESFIRGYKIGMAIRVIEKIVANIVSITDNKALVLFVKDAVEKYTEEKYGEPREWQQKRESGCSEYALLRGYHDGGGVTINAAIEGESK